MINNLSFRRSRQQFQETSVLDTTIRQDANKSSFIMLQEIDKRLVAPKGFRLASPLRTNDLFYPKELQTIMLRAQQPITGYSEEEFWVAIKKYLYVWSYIHTQSNIFFETKMDPELISFQFPERIRALNYIKSPIISFVHKKVVGLFVVALESYIELFVFEDRKLNPLNIRVRTQERVQHIVGDSKGNIYYVGDTGVVKQLQNQSQKRTKFKNRNGMNLVTRITHNFNMAKVEIQVKRMLINQKRNRLHCLIVKKYRTPWLLKPFKKQDETEVVEVQTYVLNQLTYHHRFNNDQFYRQLVATNQEYLVLDRKTLKITDIFITPESLLGLVLSNGAFIKLINTRTMTIGTIDRLPSIPTEKIILQRLRGSEVVNEYYTLSSLGENSISQFLVKHPEHNSDSIFSSMEERYLTVYISVQSFDYSFELKGPKYSTFERKKVGIEKYIENTIFASSKEFVSFVKEGIICYNKLTPLEILVAILNIHYECIVSAKQNGENFSLLQPYTDMYSTVLMCTYLIQIICARSIEVIIASSTVQNTKSIYYRLPALFERVETNSNRIYTNSLPIRKLAESLLQRYECKIIGLERQNLGSIFERNLKDVVNDKTDVLWNCLTYYFNEVFRLVKTANMKLIQKQKGLIYYVKEKLNIFERFLRKKLEEQVNVVSRGSGTYSRFVINRAQGQTLPIQRIQHQVLPQNLTSNLIVRLIQNIKQIFSLINAFQIVEGEFPDDITVEGVLTDESIRGRFATIFFKNTNREHPTALELLSKMPEFLVYLNKPNLGESRRSSMVQSSPPSGSQILSDLRQIFENYRIAQEQYSKFRDFEGKNQLGDIFDRADVKEAKGDIDRNFDSLKQDQQSFEGIMLKLINNVKTTRTNQANELLKLCVMETKRHNIPIYMQIASSLLDSQGMIVQRNILQGPDKEEKLPGFKVQHFSLNPNTSIFRL